MRRKWLAAAPLVALVVLFSALPTLAQENGDAEAVRLPALGIRAPRIAPPGEEITIVVFDRATEAPVAEAGVWAVPSDAPEELKAEIADLRESAGEDDVDWQSFFDSHGEFLGDTTEDGQLDAIFAEEGRYLLVAFKPDYRPAFRPLLVETPPKALGIDVAHRVVVGEEVTITVFDRTTGEPVEGAAVWAMPRVNSGRLKSELPKLREYGNAVATIEEFKALLGDAVVGGEVALFGRTDQDGRVTHTFAEAGRYFLVAFKPGSRAVFTPLNVRLESGNNRGLTTNNRRRPTADNGGPQLKAARPLPEQALRAAEPAKLRRRGKARDLTPAALRR